MTILWGAVLCFLLIAPLACTIHFKATDVELDTVANATYELEKVVFFEPDSEE